MSSVTNIRSAVRVLGLVAVPALSGCDHESATTALQLGETGGAGETGRVILPVPPQPAAHGHYEGAITIAGESYAFDSLLTVEGEIRMHIGPSSDYLESSQGTMQFVGTFEVLGERLYGSGVVIGQGCTATDSVRFCDEVAIGVLRGDVKGDGFAAMIDVSTTDDSETWLLETHWFDYSYDWGPATVDGMENLYNERLGGFDGDQDTVINFDKAGRFYFQSPRSGCIGNGTLVPRPAQDYAVLDASLLVENCDASYASLNGELEGLATTYLGDAWGWWTDGLMIWLSTTAGAPQETAMTLRPRVVYDP